MRDAMPGDRARHGGVVGLVRELRRVHADDHETIPESLLERPQLLDDAQAVDAAERPEIEHAPRVREGRAAPADGPC